VKVHLLGLLIDPGHHQESVNLLLFEEALEDRSEFLEAEEVLVIFHVYRIFLCHYSGNNRNRLEVLWWEVSFQVVEESWSEGRQKIFGRVLFSLILTLAFSSGSPAKFAILPFLPLSSLVRPLI
jgi:hypothetical protein